MLKAMVSPSCNEFMASVKLPGPVPAPLVTVIVAAWAASHMTTARVMREIILQHLVRAAEDYAAKLVVVSDLLGTFNEPELEEREARRLLSAVEGGIKRVKKNSFVLATLASPNKYDGMIMEWADTAVSLSSSGDRVQAELVKHPTKPPTTSSFMMNQLLRPSKVRVAR